MKTKHLDIAAPLVAVVLACWAGAATAGTEGPSSTTYGLSAGSSQNASEGFNAFFGLNSGKLNSAGIVNTFIGANSGMNVTTGGANTLIGFQTGVTLSTADGNTAVGSQAGSSAVGDFNVYLGRSAGYSDTGSHRLFIDNCAIMQFQLCDRPLVYGEFDNRLLAIDGVVHVTAHRKNAAVKSQLHFSVTGADVGGWMTSAGENNFFTSSGARYDANAGGWIQRSADGNAVIAGSGAAGFRVLTSSGTSVGAIAAPIARLHIDYNGLMGVNAAPVAGRAINTATGAYLSSGGVWTNASSRALKSDIAELPAERALEAFRDLKPVTFRYTDESAGHVGFIAEDVPELVATADRKGLSPMDVVAVLTKVLQEKSRVIERHEADMAALRAQVHALAEEVRRRP